MFQASGPVQSAYDRYAPAGYAGMPATESGWDVDTRIFEDVSPHVGIGWGLAVSQGAGDRGAVVGGSAFVGITRSNITQSTHEFTDKYSNGDNLPVAIRGDWYVSAEAVVVAGEAVYYNTTTGVIGHSGGTAILGARWMTSTTGANQLAVVRLGDASKA